MSTTMAGSWDRRRHFVRWHCAIATARFSPRRFCRGLEGYTMRCIHLRDESRASRWRITSSRLKRLPSRMLRALHTEWGILLTDFSAAYPSVNHCWIFQVLEKAKLPEFICRFLRRIYCDSTTCGICRNDERTISHGPGAGGEAVLRAASCLHWRSIASSVGSRMRSFQGTLLAWTSSSRFRVLMLTTLHWLLRPFDGWWLNCCWVQYGSESCQYLLGWMSTNCEEFLEMMVLKYAKYVGTLIGLDGHVHRWTVPRKKSFSEPKKNNASTKSCWEIVQEWETTQNGCKVRCTQGWELFLSDPTWLCVKRGKSLSCLLYQAGMWPTV